MPHTPTRISEPVHTAKQRIRQMCVHDFDDVMEMEKKAFPSPWTAEQFRSTLQNRYVVGWIAEYEGMLNGYLVYGCQNETFEILNLAVHPDVLRCGIGTQFIEFLKRKLTAKRNRILAFVTEHNLIGHQFFRSHGFIATGISPAHFEDGSDAYKFVFRGNP